MAIRLGLVAFFQGLAKDWRTYTANRLDRGVGLKGRFAAKRIDNGKPLGYHRTQRGIPGRVRHSRIKATKRGFTVTVASRLGDRVFHYGRAGKRGKIRARPSKPGARPVKIGAGYFQAKRPYAGITATWDNQAFRKYIKFIKSQGKKIGPKAVR